MKDKNGGPPLEVLDAMQELLENGDVEHWTLTEGAEKVPEFGYFAVNLISIKSKVFKDKAEHLAALALAGQFIEFKLDWLATKMHHDKEPMTSTAELLISTYDEEGRITASKTFVIGSQDILRCLELESRRDVLQEQLTKAFTAVSWEFMVGEGLDLEFREVIPVIDHLDLDGPEEIEDNSEVGVEEVKA